MDDTLTLQQGLTKFQEDNLRYFGKKPVTEAGKAFLQSHDVAHVIFGCSTSLYGEGIVKIWTTFGTTLSFRQVLNGYHDAKAFSLFQLYSPGHITKNLGRLLISMPKAIIHAKRMYHPWPFHHYQSYLTTSIADIWREFNIVVVEKE